MGTRLRYYSVLEASGYGLSAVANVRALVNAGVAVQWLPLSPQGGQLLPARVRASTALHEAAQDDAALADLDALLAATAAPVEATCAILHCVPEHWQRLIEPGLRNYGYVAWETDRLPEHWLPIFNAMQGVLVPSTFNRDACRTSGVGVAVHVVPHVRRHAWNEFSGQALRETRREFGIPPDHFVFYCIGTWQPRKAMPQLLEVFARAFSASDKVSLILKTDPQGYAGPPFFEAAPTLELAHATLDQLARTIDHALPHVCLLPYTLSGRAIDLLHELGDCYVSLSHGEGWGIGAFDAATRGTPVLMSGWGGQLDYLGADWPGALAWRETAAVTWPCARPSYWSSQRWAQVDTAAAIVALRALHADPAAARHAAATIQLDVLGRFAEPVVAAHLVAAVDA